MVHYVKEQGQGGGVPEQCHGESLAPIIVRNDSLCNELAQSRLDDSGFFGRKCLQYTPSLHFLDEGGMQLT